MLYITYSCSIADFLSVEDAQAQFGKAKPQVPFSWGTVKKRVMFGTFFTLPMQSSNIISFVL